MTLGCVPMCEYCRRKFDHVPLGKEALGCEAFPDGIPERIFGCAFDHRTPYANDNGKVFEPKTPEALGEYTQMLKRQHREF